MAARFYLIPVRGNVPAEEVVQLNQQCAASYHNRPCIGIALPERVTPGYLATVGTDRTNDIVLPVHPRRPYSRFHCAFLVAPSGELILRDFTWNSTQLRVRGLVGIEQDTYDLQGTRHRPRVRGLAGIEQDAHDSQRTDYRQRVIPRVTWESQLSVGGGETLFTLLWDWRCVGKGTERSNVGKALRKRAHFPNHNLPNDVSPRRLGNAMADGQRYLLRRNYVPPLSAPRAPEMQVHRYELLGKGGFGVVSRVVNLANGAIWALKEVKGSKMVGGENRWMEDFLREVEILSGLRHENIVHLEHFQGFSLEGEYQLFYKLCSGSVRTMLPKLGDAEPVPEPKYWVCIFVDDVLSGLRHLHENKIVHRDLKPDNILVEYPNHDTNQPRFAISDFGLSIKLGAHSTSAFPGTSLYRAPEVCVYNANWSPATDVWALGVTLGEVLGYWKMEDSLLEDTAWANRIQIIAGSYGIQLQQLRLREWMRKGENDNRDTAQSWAYRLLELSSLKVLPRGLAAMLQNQYERPPVQNLCDFPRQWFWVAPDERKSEHGESHISLHSQDDRTLPDMWTSSTFDNGSPPEDSADYAPY